MEQNTVNNMLKDLKSCLKKIKASLAWEQLKNEEKSSHLTSGSLLEDSTIQELRNSYSQFLTLSLQIHRQLADPSSILGKQQKEQYRKQLQRMEAEVRTRHLPERFINL